MFRELLPLFQSLLAQSTGFGYDTRQVGSSGTLVGASLETVGHYMQAQLLDVFALGIGDTFAGFLYVLAGMGAILILAIGGNYKYGLWFLFGPAVFFALTSVRVPSTGPVWQFGTRELPQDRVVESIDGVFAEGFALASESGEAIPTDVSWFFARWNQVSSSIVQAFVSIVNGTGNYTDLHFVEQGSRYNALFNQSIRDPELQTLTQLLMVQECGNYFTQRMLLYADEINEPQRLELERQLRAGTAQSVSLATYPNISSYIAGQDADVRARIRESIGDGSTPWGSMTLNCDQVWGVVVELTRAHARLIFAEIYGRNTGTELDELPILESRRRLLEKFILQQEEWLAEDQEHYGNLNPLAESPQERTDGIATSYLINELAGRMLLREMSHVDPNIVQSDFGRYPVTTLAGDSPEQWNTLHEDHEDDVARAIRRFSAGVEYQGKGDFLTSMLALPYVQGVALFFLAITFPFFALSVVIPGRHSGILMWMSLWFWIKSWDFGFAVVMLVDRLLYMLLPHGPPLGEADMGDSGRLFKELLTVDPSYSVFTYYNLIAVCLAAVPALTGVFVQRGAGPLISTIENTFANYGGRVGSSMGLFQRSIIAGTNTRRAHTSLLNYAGEASRLAALDPEVASYFTQAGVYGAIQESLQRGTFNGITAEIAKLGLNADQQRALATGTSLYNARVAQLMWQRSRWYDHQKLYSLSVGDGLFSRHNSLDYAGVGSNLIGALAHSVHPHIDQEASEQAVFRGVNNRINPFGSFRRDDDTVGNAFDSFNQVSGRQTAGESIVTFGHWALSGTTGFHPEFDRGSHPYTRPQQFEVESTVQADHPVEVNGAGPLGYETRPEGYSRFGDLIARVGVPRTNPTESPAAEPVTARSQSFQAGGVSAPNTRFGHDPMLTGSSFSLPIQEGELGTDRTRAGASDFVRNEVLEIASLVSNSRELDEREHAVLLASLEQSGFNPSFAEQNSSAVGVGRFTSSEWQSVWQDMARRGELSDEVTQAVNQGQYPDRRDPYASTIALAESLTQERDRIESAQPGRTSVLSASGLAEALFPNLGSGSNTSSEFREAASRYHDALTGEDN